MNIFLLDYNIERCARYHCDKHVVKMPLETTQMLSTVHWRYGSERILAILTDPPINLKARGKTKHPQAMPDEYKSPSSLQAYRQYYIGEKTRLCVWKKRKIPPFMREAMLLHSLNQKMSA